jgi:ATP-dependent Clp endopeptidase proteolytic subunit ClpP
METTMKMTCAVKTAGETLDVDIHDTIGGDFFSEGVTSKQVLEKVSKAEGVRKIQVRINSGGGDVFQGLAIYNTLAAHSARKIVTIDGLAASMASVIAMAGDEIHMPANAMMMVHNPRARSGGEAAELRRSADVLEKMRDNLANIYAARTGQSLATVVAQMEAETWMTAEEAKNLGYADFVTDARRLVAQWDSGTFRRAPTNVLAQVPFHHLDSAERLRLAREDPETCRLRRAGWLDSIAEVRAKMKEQTTYEGWLTYHRELQELNSKVVAG